MTSSIKIQLISDNQETYDYIYPLLNDTSKVYNRAYCFFMLYHDKQLLGQCTLPTTTKNGITKTLSIKTIIYHRVAEEFPHLNTGVVSNIVYTVDKHFKTDVKKGMMHGWRQPRTYKSGAGAIYQFLKGHLNPQIAKEDQDYFLYLRQDLKFKMILGYGKKRWAEANRIAKLLESFENKTLELSAEFTIKRIDRKLFLILTYVNPETKNIPDPDKILGVDVGVRRILTASIKDDDWNRLYVHNDELIRKKLRFEKSLRNLTQSLSMTSGGHGRNKKMKARERYSNSEKNFTENMLHNISSQLIKYCTKNNIGQINLELLDRKHSLSDDISPKDIFFMRFWPISNLMAKIAYKAERENIVIKYVDPYHTSKTCSCCGEIGVRNKENFTCTNPKCTEYNKTVDSDLNASRNIAKSTKYVEKIEDTTFYKKYTKKETTE